MQPRPDVSRNGLRSDVCHQLGAFCDDEARLCDVDSNAADFEGVPCGPNDATTDRMSRIFASSRTSSKALVIGLARPFSPLARSRTVQLAFGVDLVLELLDRDRDPIHR